MKGYSREEFIEMKGYSRKEFIEKGYSRKEFIEKGYSRKEFMEQDQALCIDWLVAQWLRENPGRIPLMAKLRGWTWLEDCGPAEDSDNLQVKADEILLSSLEPSIGPPRSGNAMLCVDHVTYVYYWFDPNDESIAARRSERAHRKELRF